MNAVAAAVLRSAQGVPVPLKGVTAKGRITGLVFELTVEQEYENSSGTNIEAEYTFPVPHRAVLLGLDLFIGRRELRAVAVRRQTARERYEEAIDAGDTAVLLEQAGDGLYSLSFGNLMAGERARIRYRYAELLDRSGDDVRVMVPTVIAPRYGDAVAGGLAPHQVPGTDLLAAYPFSIEIDVEGDMARTTLASPSHDIVMQETASGRCVRLTDTAWLDRDFVLTLTGIQTRSASLVAHDGEEYVALLSLDPRLVEPAPTPLALKIVVDCSGSMGGESIACARRALTAILDRLDPRDCVSITRFGSTVDHVPVRAEETVPATGVRAIFGRSRPRTVERSGALAAATPSVIECLRHRVREMDADLGGTELPGALSAAIAIPVPSALAKNILLITDAEVWAVQAVLDEAVRSGHRLFVVVVGAAPAEALGRELAAKTGGACEFVAPGEDAEAAIVRTFRRMREAPKRVTRIEWPATPLWQAPLPTAVFSGDTLHLIAGFTTPPLGTVRVVVGGGADSGLRGELTSVVTHEVLPRLAAAKRLATLDAGEAAVLAERYQLASKHTSFIVVELRADQDRATAIPTLASVPQMLAAGWGGTALTCRASQSLSNIGAFKRQGEYAAISPDACMSRANPLPPDLLSLSEPPWLKLPHAVPADLSTADSAGNATPEEVLAALRDLVAAGAPLPGDFAGLAALGVPAAVIDLLRTLAQVFDPLGNTVDLEARLVRVWIALLARSPAGSSLAREHLDALKGQVLGERGNRTIRNALARAFADVSAQRWTKPEVQTA